MAIIHPFSSKTQMLFAFYIFWLSLLIPQGSSLSFNFNFSDPSIVNESINFQKDAFYNNDGSISLTSYSYEKGNFTTGRATYNQPVLLWDENSGEVTNFTTEFTFLIRNVTEIRCIADGFTFFLIPFPAKIPPHAFIAGKYLALFENTTALNPSMNQIVGVEFDTYYNADIEPGVVNCHVGIDINTIISTSYMPMNMTPEGGCLFVDSRMIARIQYNSGLKLLSLLLWSVDNPNNTFNLSASIDISKVLPTSSAVGFSAATGSCFELHQIYSWSFDSTLEVKQDSSSSPPSNSPLSNSPPSSSTLSKDKSTVSGTIVGGTGAGVFLILLLGGIMMYCLKQKRSNRHAGDTEESDDKSIDYEFEKGRGPKRFSYSELVESTNGFVDSNKLGEGGFGSVYRGILTDENIQIAVKRVSKESKQGKKEYISEVKTISRLRHRNLVQLVGWCHGHGEFLLVYELMHNGSLDKHLYSTESQLTWPIRQNIALGLGSALLYLHEEWEQCVVHRDVKPSNVMLDSSFNAKLGDFGLARVTDHHQDLKTTIVAGTRGYIAPECLLGTENASSQSDVFSFGVVLLEIVCGRRPIEHEQDQRKASLVKWVWDLYGQKTLLGAVDDRLNGNFEREEVECFMVVGLWCAHPEKSLRPSIKQAMSVLQFQARMPNLPPKMPVASYVAPLDPNMEQYTSSEATSSGVTVSSTKSAPAISSHSSLMLKQQANTM